MRRDSDYTDVCQYELEFVDLRTGARSKPFAVISDELVAPFSASWICAGNVSMSSNCPSWSSLIPASFSLNNTIVSVTRSIHPEKLHIPLAAPVFMDALPENVLFDVHFTQESMMIQTNAVAAFVWITSEACQPLQNNLFIFPAELVVVDWRGCDMAMVEKTYRIHHVKE
jgi:hypothetical protein